MNPFDASDPAHIRKAAKAAKADAAQRLEIVRGIMSLPSGRAWMHDWLQSCNIFATTFTGNALQSAFNEGRRSIGLRMLAEIMQACPDQYVQMMREENERDIVADIRRHRRSDIPDPDDNDGGPDPDDRTDDAA